MSQYTGINAFPAAKAPPGVTVEVHGGPSLGPPLVALSAILIPIVLFTVTCRTIASSRTPGPKGGIGWADVMSILAAIFSIATAGVWLSLYKFERHQYDLLVGDLTGRYLKAIFAGEMLSWPAILFAKVSILLLYLRLFDRSRLIRYGSWVGIFWAVATYVPLGLATSYYCAPHAGGNWDLTVGLRCRDTSEKIWLVTTGAMSLILDIYCLILPIAPILRLQMSTRQKVGVLSIFLTAIFACICAILSLVYRIRIAQLDLFGDNIWIGSQLFITTIVENFIAIIVGAIPGTVSFMRITVSKSTYLSALQSRMSSRFKGSGYTSSSSPSKLSQSGNFGEKSHLRSEISVTDGHGYTRYHSPPEDYSNSYLMEDRQKNQILVERDFQVAHNQV